MGKMLLCVKFRMLGIYVPDLVFLLRKHKFPCALRCAGLSSTIFDHCGEFKQRNYFNSQQSSTVFRQS